MNGVRGDNNARCFRFALPRDSVVTNYGRGERSKPARLKFMEMSCSLAWTSGVAHLTPGEPWGMHCCRRTGVNEFDDFDAGVFRRVAVMGN